MIDQLCAKNHFLIPHFTHGEYIQKTNKKIVCLTWQCTTCDYQYTEKFETVTTWQEFHEVTDIAVDLGFADWNPPF